MASKRRVRSELSRASEAGAVRGVEQEENADGRDQAHEVDVLLELHPATIRTSAAARTRRRGCVVRADIRA